MLTKQDIKQIQEVITISVESRLISLDHKIEEMDQKIEELQQQIKYLPTTDQYLTEADKIYGEIRNMREAQEILVGWKDQIEDHESRLEKVETKLEHW